MRSVTSPQRVGGAAMGSARVRKVSAAEEDGGHGVSWWRRCHIRTGCCGPFGDLWITVASGIPSAPWHRGGREEEVERCATPRC